MPTVSVTFFKVDQKRIEQALQAYVRALTEHAEVLAIVLFGSLARGEATGMSDADILLILAHSTKPFHLRIPDYLLPGIRIPMDVFPYTVEEAHRMLAEGNGIVPMALQDGIWLLDRADVRRRLMEHQSMVSPRGIQRAEG